MLDLLGDLIRSHILQALLLDHGLPFWSYCVQRFRKDIFPVRPEITRFGKFPQALLTGIHRRVGKIESPYLGRREPTAYGALRDELPVAVRAPEHQELSGSLVVTPHR